MKRLFVLLIAAALLLSLVACSSSDSNKKTDAGSQASTTEATQTAEATEAVTEEATQAPEATEVDDDALVEETKAKMVGSWSYTGMEDYVRLTFNEDGTGSYKGPDEEFTFTYSIAAVHKTFNNGEPYIDKTMTVNYSTGESEEIVIDFLQEGTEQLTFHTTEGGGYSGIITYYGGWIKV